MAFAERAVRDHHLDRLRQLQQPHQVRDRRAAASEALGQLAVSLAEVLDERRARDGDVDRREVLADEVLDECDLETLAGVHGAHHHGDAREAGEPRGPPAALAGDEHVRPGRVGRRDDDRLDHARRPDGGGQRLQGRVVDAGAGLVGVGDDRIEGQLARAGGGGSEDRLGVAEQGRQPAAQAATVAGGGLSHGRRPPSQPRSRRRRRRSAGRSGSPARRTTAPRRAARYAAPRCGTRAPGSGGAPR